MDVFVYGTLADRTTAASLLEEFSYRGSARLVGLHRVDGRYPTLAPGGTTQGRLLRTAEIAALDDYEGVDRGLYVRVALPLADLESDDTVACYVGDPAAVGAPVDWPGSGPFPERVRAFCREEDVLVERI